MTTVNLLPDDVNLQRLRADNEKPATTQQVAGVAPSRPVQKNRAPDEKIRPVNAERRRNQERRQGERRKRQQSVLLDTRSHRERRRNTGKRHQDQRLQQRRIDIKI
ncbi:MAG: hypothetical protein PVJ63_04215 [Thioalkalispiraceae bacterium]|jgi:hypothetical protein